MCHVITIAVPASAAAHVRLAFGRGFQVQPTANRQLLAAIPAGYTAQLITSGGCSCDLYAPQEIAGQNDLTQRLHHRYSKLNWSERKKERAIQEALKHEQAKRAQTTWSGLRPDVVQKLQQLCEEVATIALLVHWYDSEVESEEISLVGTDSCRCDTLAEHASRLRTDVLLLATGMTRSTSGGNSQ